MTQRAQETSNRHMKIDRILVSTDFSPLADHAVTVAADYAQRYNAHLTLVHVMPPLFSGAEGGALSVPMTYYGDDLLEMYKERLEKRAEELRAQGIKVDTEVPLGVPFVEIVKLARQTNTDLIVISTHGRTGLGHALIGSTAERVVRKAPCPVLSIRPPESDDD